MTKLRCMLCCLMICTITIDARTVNDIYKRISAQVSLKVPGNQSRNYSLAFQGAVDDKGIYLLESEEKIPLIITERIERDNVKCVMVVSITALEDVYFNYQQQLKTGFRHNDCMFYLPGFWYSRNLRSPKGAPSFHISESWLVREDRLSSPLIACAIAIHNIPEGISVSVPIYYATGNRKRALWLSFLSGLAEPVGAVIGYLILAPFLNDHVFGVIFGMIAGIMVFISLDELLPAAEEYGKHHHTIYGLVAGMAVMALNLLMLC